MEGGKRITDDATRFTTEQHPKRSTIPVRYYFLDISYFPITFTCANGVMGQSRKPTHYLVGLVRKKKQYHCISGTIQNGYETRETFTPLT